MPKRSSASVIFKEALDETANKVKKREEKAIEEEDGDSQHQNEETTTINISDGVEVQKDGIRFGLSSKASIIVYYE